MGKLDGEVAIVTGASRGIGRAVAFALAREGAHIALNAAHEVVSLKKVEEEIASMGNETLVLLADVAKRSEVDLMVQAMIEKWGRIDVLVNNAGILRPVRLEKLSEQQWDETLAVHLKGTFNCTQAVLPVMQRQKKGKIINVAAPSALRGSFGVADYAAAKGGIIAFTRNAANELKSHNIQVNCVVPVADTRMTEILTQFRREQLGQLRRDRQFVAPEAIAPAFVFFATAESDYVSGQVLEVGR